MNATSRSPDEHSLAGLKHLKTSSQLLQPTCPALSAYLASKSNTFASILKVTDKDDPTTKLCQRCGNAMIPGWSCKKARRPASMKNAKKNIDGVAKASTKESNPDTKDYIAYDCDLCHTVTRFRRPERDERIMETKVQQVPVHPSENLSKESISATPPLGASHTTTSSAPSSAAQTPTQSGQVAAKKRKKNKSGGLAALLAKSKSESASPSGFDLMDFMKSG